MAWAQESLIQLLIDLEKQNQFSEKMADAKT